MAVKRKQIGSLIKSKDADKPNYIKIGKEAVTLQPGQTLRAESKKYQLQSLESAVAAGKLHGEVAESIRARIEKMPDWVIAELIVLDGARD